MRSTLLEFDMTTVVCNKYEKFYESDSSVTVAELSRVEVERDISPTCYHTNRVHNMHIREHKIGTYKHNTTRLQKNKTRNFY